MWWIVLLLLFLYLILQKQQQNSGTGTGPTLGSSSPSSSSSSEHIRETESELINFSATLAVSALTGNPLPAIGEAVSILMGVVNPDHSAEIALNEANAIANITNTISTQIDVIQRDTQTIASLGQVVAQIQQHGLETVLTTLNSDVTLINSTAQQYNALLQQAQFDLNSSAKQVSSTTVDRLVSLMQGVASNFDVYLIEMSSLLTQPLGALSQFLAYESAICSQYGTFSVPTVGNYPRFVTNKFLTAIWSFYQYYQTAEILCATLLVESKNAKPQDVVAVRNQLIVLNSQRYITGGAPFNNPNALQPLMAQQLKLLPLLPFASDEIVWDQSFVDAVPPATNVIWGAYLLTQNGSPNQIWTTDSVNAATSACRLLGLSSAPTNVGNISWLGGFTGWVLPTQRQLVRLFTNPSLTQWQTIGIAKNASNTSKIWAMNDFVSPPSPGILNLNTMAFEDVTPSMSYAVLPVYLFSG